MLVKNFYGQMTFHIITLFPHSFDSYLGESILKRAIKNRKIMVKFYNPRDFAGNKHDRVDRKPYGGGPGMVIQALPVIRALESAYSYILQNVGMTNARLRGIKKNDDVKIIWLSPQGKQFTNEYAKKTAKKYSDIIIVCGRYEGIDARVKKAFKVEEISVGPFILTGGELPAMILIDAISRQIEGVLGDFNSLEESRVSSPDVYTRPEIFEWLNHFDKSGRPIGKANLGKKKKYRVPKVLLGGNHAKIEEWKKRKL